MNTRERSDYSLLTIHYRPSASFFRNFAAVALFDRLHPAQETTMPVRNRPPTRPKSATVQPVIEDTQEKEKSAEAPEAVPELRLLGEMRSLTTREERIAMSAYWRAASRQFTPGHELDDWLAAEAEVDSKDREERSSVNR
jgi:hypothetical protein